MLNVDINKITSSVSVFIRAESSFNVCGFICCRNSCRNFRLLTCSTVKWPMQTATGKRFLSCSTACSTLMVTTEMTRKLMKMMTMMAICQVSLTVWIRDHSFPRNAEFWAETRNLPISAEFLCFHGILHNLTLDGGKGTNTAYFDGVRATVLYVYMISPWNTWLPLGLWWEEYWTWAYLKYCRLIW